MAQWCYTSWHMKTEIKNNKIIIYDLNDFNAKQIVECGQIFRFKILSDKIIVYSKDKKCDIYTYSDRAEIVTKDTQYFYNFFDLKTDYTQIKNQLKSDSFLSPAIKFGYGIRILKNDLFEIIVSFIISANNNIKRIQKSIEMLCEKFGDNKSDYYAFPRLEQLKKATVSDFVQAGLGYRAQQLHHTIQNLTDESVAKLKTLPTNEQEKFLLTLKGVGEKVKNCIMLFGLGVATSFPVDTWINKSYNDLTNNKNTNRKQITKELTKKYGNLSGYAQQYLFYYYRQNKLK